jgi:hypothetical protein
MPRQRTLPAAMMTEIDAVLSHNTERCISVYAGAEKVRSKWEVYNVALEDVVAVFVERCGLHSVAMSFDRGEVDVLVEERQSLRQVRNHG